MENSEKPPYQRRPLASDIVESFRKICVVIDSDLSSIISEITSAVGISYWSSQSIIGDDLYYQKVSVMRVYYPFQKYANCKSLTMRKKTNIFLLRRNLGAPHYTY